MGLIADTLEDNVERASQTSTDEFSPFESPVELPPSVVCPVCERVFGGELGLQNHIRKEHGRTHIYLKADDRIVRSTEYFPTTPRSCELIPLGVDRVDVTVEAGGTSLRFVTHVPVDLLKRLPKGQSGKVRVTASSAGLNKSFVLFFGTKPPFDQKALDRLIADLQSSLDGGQTPNWNAYQEKQRRIVQSELENRYLDGFFEYSLGFHLEKQAKWRESASHLEAAMQLLHPFATPLARTARRVLALRMNCFSSLKLCHPESVFYRAKVFFGDDLLKLPKPSQERFGSGEHSVYVDGFTELILLALKTFYAHDFTNTLFTLSQLANHPLSEDRNNEDKVTLIRARTARVQGDVASAKSAYEALQYHPYFRSEADSYLHSSAPN